MSYLNSLSNMSQSDMLFRHMSMFLNLFKSTIFSFETSVKSIANYSYSSSHIEKNQELIQNIKAIVEKIETNETYL